MWKTARGVALGAVLALLVVEADGADFFVAPNPGSGGNGSTERPWRLAFALSHPPEVKPGDTIWLRGGVYSGSFVSFLAGTPANPVVVRAYPGERVTLDGGTSVGSVVLTVSGRYAWYWGLEVTSSDSDKTSASDDNWPDDIGPGYGIAAGTESSTGLRFINLVVHDTAMGIAAMSAWSDTEIYGCLIYYNGWNALSGSKGHGIYAQNETGTKKIVENLIFQQFSHGVHAYTEDGYLDNIWVEGNILFANGVVSGYEGRNLLLGGSQVAQNPTVRSNMLYNGPDRPASSFDIGYLAGCTNPTIVDNYIVDNSYVVNCKGGVRTGNSRRSAVAVDLSGVLSVGAHFEIRNAQDFFATPVLSGTYSGGEVALPMTGLTVATPNGVPPPLSTGPEFNAFVVLTKTDATSREPIPIRDVPSDSPPPVRGARRAK